MPKITLGTVVKLVVLSLVVGLAMAAFDATPGDVIRAAVANVDAAFRWMADTFGWLASYIILGAVIVVPVWAILFVLRWARGKGGKA